MTLATILVRPEFRAVTADVLGREPSDAEHKALVDVAIAAEGQIEAERIDEDLDEMVATRSETERVQVSQKIFARIARGVLEAKLADPHGILSPDTAKWIRYNVAANDFTIHRPIALWLVSAGLGDAHDQVIFDHAVNSALAGTTQQPVPQAKPEPVKGPEAIMKDPTQLRDKILQNTVFNPAGLPQKLRKEKGQQIYLDAVIHAVDLLGHPPDEADAKLWAGATAALLLYDGHYDPRDQRFFQQAQRIVAELSGSAEETGTIAIDSHKVKGEDVTMFAPDPTDTQRIKIFAKTWNILNARAGKNSKVFLQSYAAAARKMVDRYDEHQGNTDIMDPLVTAAYEDHVNDSAGGGGGGGVVNVDLPPLNDPQGYNDEIERDNIKAVSTIYVSYQLEFALKACARVLDLFVAGLLPINASDGGARELDTLYWDQEDLPDEATRRSIQARVLGAPGGEVGFGVQPNTEFNTLLMRAVSAVSEYEREQSVLTHFDNAARGQRFQSTSGEFVRKAIRDFAANVSLRGWAGTAFAAERLASQIKRVMRVLNLPSVKNAFGVTTPWQVVERVSQREFGITVNTVLHRTLAVETQRIMSIIADNHTIWSNGSGLKPLFSKTKKDEGDLSLADTRALMIACQHFRAVTGIDDMLLNEYSEPVETAAQPSLPDIGGSGGMGGGIGVPEIDMGGINQLRDMVNSGETPSIDQIRTLLPGFG